MQVEEIKQDGLVHEFKVTVTANDIDKRIDERLVEVGKTYRIPGFRPGKVPLKILRQKLGKAVMGEVLEKAVNESSAEAFKSKDITPAVQPKIEVKEFDEGKDLEYSINVEVLPKFKLADFKGLKLEKLVAKAEDEQIENALKQIAENNKPTKKIEEKRAAKKGDFAIIDYDGRTADDDVRHDGMKAEGHKLELGGGQFIEGFEEQIIGKKPGESFEVKVKFPENYGADFLSDRDAIFDVTLQEIHETGKAEISDDMAKNLGMEDLEALKKVVAEQLAAEFDNTARMLLKKHLLDFLDENHTFDVPPSMFEMEYKNILDQLELEKQRNPDADQSEISDEEKEDFKRIAERRVRLGLILSEVGKTNSVTVTDADLQRAVIAEAQKYPGQERQVFDYYAKNRNALESLRAPMFEEKVVDFILELAEISEKDATPDEIVAALEGDEDMKEDKSKKKAAAKKSEKKPEGKSEKKDDKPKKSAPPKKKASGSKKK